MERMWGGTGADPDHGRHRFHRSLHPRAEPARGRVPLVNFDNNQHGDNENLRPENLWTGIVSLAAMFEM
jgi:hypothetical protein